MIKFFKFWSKDMTAWERLQELEASPRIAQLMNSQSNYEADFKLAASLFTGFLRNRGIVYASPSFRYDFAEFTPVDLGVEDFEGDPTRLVMRPRWEDDGGVPKETKCQIDLASPRPDADLRFERLDPSDNCRLLAEFAISSADSIANAENAAKLVKFSGMLDYMVHASLRQTV